MIVTKLASWSAKLTCDQNWCGKSQCNYLLYVGALEKSPLVVDVNSCFLIGASGVESGLLVAHSSSRKPECLVDFSVCSSWSRTNYEWSAWVMIITVMYLHVDLKMLLYTDDVVYGKHQLCYYSTGGVRYSHLWTPPLSSFIKCKAWLTYDTGAIGIMSIVNVAEEISLFLVKIVFLMSKILTTWLVECNARDAGVEIGFIPASRRLRRNANASVILWTVCYCPTLLSNYESVSLFISSCTGEAQLMSELPWYRLWESCDEKRCLSAACSVGASRTSLRWPLLGLC